MRVDEYMTTGEAARRLDVSPEYVRRLVSAGQLRAIRSRFGNLYHPADIAQFARNRASKRAG